MEESSVTRIKCAMIVYELERALGRYVREHDSVLPSHEAAQEILRRSEIPGTGAKQGEELTQVIVENSYLGEILSLAHSTAKGTSDAAQLVVLDKLANALSLFEIRNAVSHPNRPFPECYWYRCAAVAADPCIDALGFYEVSLALQNATDGKLVEPPENWLYKKRWSVPTVLPSEFEHSVTGLYGRAKDIAKLERDLRNSRAPLIALVARGGIGKTSLLLQVISDFCLSAEAPQYFDGVLWASFKQERLTAAGIELLSAPQGLNELETLLCQEAAEIFGLDIPSFDNMKTTLGEKRMLLCLDNLETLLRDSPQQFNEFYEALPSKWKVIVTSRIPVDNAKNIPLDVLDKPGSVALARAYLSSRGVPTADGALLEKICSGSSYNPLAIRITIELYLAGAEIASALQSSEQEVLAFSFKTLLDRLSSLENDLLETVFVMEEPNRSDICSALDIGADQASEMISKLAKMSLITRQEAESGETYALGTSIRDLLRSNPRNLQTRSRIVQWVSKSRAITQEAIRHQNELNLSPCDLSYFPSTANPALISACKQIRAAARREDRSALVSIESDLRRKLESQPSALLHRLYAWTALELTDASTAITHFRRASALDREDPAPRLGLALTLHSQANWSETEKEAKELIDSGWGTVEKANRYFANRIWAVYLQSLNIQEKYADVFAHTEDWSEKINDLPALAIGRASALRRRVNLLFKPSTDMDQKGLLELGTQLASASILLLKVLIREGFVKWYLPELRKNLSELQFHLEHGTNLSQIAPEDLQSISHLLRFCLSNDGVRAGLNESEIRKLLESLDPSRNSPKQPNLVAREQLQSQGFILAKIKKGIRPEAKYFFAQDERGIDYFIHFEQFEHGNSARRHLINPAACVALKFASTDTGNALKATEAWLVDQEEGASKS